MIYAVEGLTDAFRWWASLGAFIGASLLLVWLKNGIQEVIQERRFLAVIAILATLYSIMLAGAIIPWATDNRSEWFTENGLPYQTLMMFAWLGWGFGAWAVGYTLTSNRKALLVGSCSWLGVCFLAADMTVGAML